MQLALLSMTCSAPTPPPPPAAAQPAPAAHAGGEGGASSDAEPRGTARGSNSDGASGVGGGATFPLEQGEPSTGAPAPAADRRDGAQGVTAGAPHLEPLASPLTPNL